MKSILSRVPRRENTYVCVLEPLQYSQLAAYLAEIVRQVRSGALDDALVYRKNLRKSADDYTAFIASSGASRQAPNIGEPTGIPQDGALPWRGDWRRTPSMVARSPYP